MVNRATAGAEEVLDREGAEPNGDGVNDFHGHPLSLDDVNRDRVRRFRIGVNRLTGRTHFPLISVGT